MCLPLIDVLGGENCNDKVTERHGKSSSDENRLSAKLVDVHYCWNGRNEQQNSNDTGGQKIDSVAADTKGPEDGWGVVEHSVDTSPVVLSVGCRFCKS